MDAAERKKKIECAFGIAQKEQERRGLKPRAHQKSRGLRKSGPERWGAKMFCKFFYSILRTEEIPTRDDMPAQEEIYPRFVREMGKVLQLLEDRQKSKAEFAKALVAFGKNWEPMVNRMCGSRKLSVYDLRYNLGYLMSEETKVQYTEDPIDMNNLFKETRE
jgi:hypothetical protein